MSHPEQFKPSPHECTGTPLAGFTLLELLVIASFLGLTACVMAPGFCRTAPVSSSAVCQNNFRQLAAAWLMYADDNRGELVYNRGGLSATRGSEAWVSGWLDFSTSNTDNTNAALLVDHELYPYTAFLGPYLRSPRAFKCPADKPTVLVSANQSLQRVRSVSMSNRMGQGSSSWGLPTLYWMYTRTSELTRPSELFVQLDEHQNSIDDGRFITATDSDWRLVDWPAMWHNGGAGFSFADGHSEIHRWKDSRTMPIVSASQVLIRNIALWSDMDVQWLQQHAATKR